MICCRAKTFAAAPESVPSSHQPPLAGQRHAILSASTTVAQASPASSWSPPTKQEQAESEDDPPAEGVDESLIGLSSLSHSEASSSSSSTSSAGEKESGSELKEWDRLSGNNDEVGTPTQDRVATSSGDVDESLVDDWEGGWDETDVTEDDMLEAVTASEPSKPSTTSDVRPTVLPVKNVLPATKGSEDLTAAASVAARQPQTGLWGKWGGWGTSLLTTAVGQVGQGLNAVMDTVEQSLGAPRPEELAARGATAEKTEDAAPVRLVWGRERHDKCQLCIALDSQHAVQCNNQLLGAVGFAEETRGTTTVRVRLDANMGSRLIRGMVGGSHHQGAIGWAAFGLQQSGRAGGTGQEDDASGGGTGPGIPADESGAQRTHQPAHTLTSKLACLTLSHRCGGGRTGN